MIHLCGETFFGWSPHVNGISRKKIGLEEEDLRRVEWNVESIRSHLRGKANSVTRRLIFTDIHDKQLLPLFKQILFENSQQVSSFLTEILQIFEFSRQNR